MPTALPQSKKKFHKLFKRFQIAQTQILIFVITILSYTVIYNGDIKVFEQQIKVKLYEYFLNNLFLMFSYCLHLKYQNFICFSWLLSSICWCVRRNKSSLKYHWQKRINNTEQKSHSGWFYLILRFTPIFLLKFCVLPCM